MEVFRLDDRWRIVRGVDVFAIVARAGARQVRRITSRRNMSCKPSMLMVKSVWNFSIIYNPFFNRHSLLLYFPLITGKSAVRNRFPWGHKIRYSQPEFQESRGVSGWFAFWTAREISRITLWSEIKMGNPFHKQLQRELYPIDSELLNQSVKGFL